MTGATDVARSAPRVAVTEADGAERELWSGTVRAASDFGRPRGRRVDCPLPASTTSLRLSRPGRGGIARPFGRAGYLVGAGDHRSQRPASLPSVVGSARPTPSAPRPPSAPLISVLTPVHDPPPHMLEEAIGSVRAQTFDDWELCLVDDGSTNPEVIAALERHAASDPRIHLKRRETAGGISAATNCRARTRHRRVHRSPRPRRHPRPRRAPARRRPDRPPTRPRHGLHRRGRRR